MSTPDLRNVDFDRYRALAAELRRQAMNQMIDRMLAWLRPHLASAARSQASATGTARSAACCA